MGITADFLKSRVDKPTKGKWCSGFTAAKKYADDNGLPFVGVWSNGDSCGYCKKFETACMDSQFTKWMSKSGIVFWFGHSGDKTADDKLNGNGCKWARNTSSLKTFPFVRVWWKKGGVDKYESGNYWIDKSADGGMKFAEKVDKLLKDYEGCDNCESDEGCDGGSCNIDGGCSEALAKMCEQVEKATESLVAAEAAIAAAKATLAEIASNCQIKD